MGIQIYSFILQNLHGENYERHSQLHLESNGFRVAESTTKNKMYKSQNNNIFVWIGLCILLIMPSIARAQSNIESFQDDSIPVIKTPKNPMWIVIDQGGWGDKIIFSHYGVIVSAFNYHGDFRRQFYNTTYYPPSKLDKCSIDSLFEYVNTHYQHSKCKEFTTNKTLTLDGTWTEIYMQNGRYVNTMGTTEDCFSKEMDVIERMANRILDELSDSNNIYTGGYVKDCDIAETSPYCYLNTLEGSTFSDFFCQFFVDDELLFTISQYIGLLYEDGQACFIPEDPDHVKKQYFYNWGKLLYRMRKDLLQCQSDTIPGMNGNYLLVRFNGQWSYVNGLDMKTLKEWLKMIDKVVPRAYRKSFKRKKEQLVLSWEKR